MALSSTAASASDLEASLQALLQDGSLQNTAWATGIFACVLLTEVVGLHAQAKVVFLLSRSPGAFSLWEWSK